ncbi:MAG: DUF1289 domain-containing protein [Gammaproteobacteria bacterium]
MRTEPREAETASAIESPCTKVCVVDSENGLCIGCGRSLAEIAAWSTLSEQERRRIISALKQVRAGNGSTS